jgi:hypothetical protein
VGGVGTAEAFSDIIKKADDDSPLKVKEIGKGALAPAITWPLA